MLKCLLAQINTTVGDIEGNLAKAIDAHRQARRAGAHLVVFPEQTFLGYPAKDILFQRDQVRRNQKALERFCHETRKGPASIVSFAEAHTGEGTGLFNSAALCRRGSVDTVYRKRLLPTYDVFDEDRYFDEGRDVCIVDIEGIPVGITVCEDIWNDGLHQGHRLYRHDPFMETACAGARVIVNLSASPFTLDKPMVRREMISRLARRHRVAVLQTNLVGANDDLIFDGSSLAVSPDGSLAAQAASFEEENLVVLFERNRHGVLMGRGSIDKGASRLEQLRRALVLGIRDYVRKCGFRSVLIGLSGGIDSALVAVLAAEALGPENVHGISMPSRYSSDHSRTDAARLAANLGIRFDTIPIEGMFAASLRDLNPHLDGSGAEIARENLQSRLRGLTLMSISNATGALVLATGNKSEMTVGYCTLYGDMNGGLAPIADLPKLLVYELSRHINRAAGRSLIPKGTLTKPPSAELRPDQKDTDSLPPYEELDPIVRGFVEEMLDEAALVARGHDPKVVHRVYTMLIRNEYKRRQAAPTLKVTSRAFGYGWRMPIARR